jgi:hypothetical protein
MRAYVITRVEKPMQIDGNASDWGKIPAIKAAREGDIAEASVRMAYDADNLYAIFDVRDDTPWANEGRDFARLFKTGDTVDIQLSPTGNKQANPKGGDLRLMVGQISGKPAVVLMQPHVEGGATAQKRVYHSPVQDRAFDRVAVLAEAKVKVQKAGQGYVVELAVPWSALGITPKPGMKMSGDVGFTGSDTAGTITMSRTYWSNPDTNLVNDEPAESWLYPQRWGTFELGN